MGKSVPKCLLLPTDGSNESLKPIDFVSRLYPRRDHIELILCHFVPPLAPVYQGKPDSQEMAKKKTQLLRSRQEQAETILNEARSALIEAGFPEEMIQEHMQEQAMSVARHACQLADIRKVDAVLVQKRISSSLEGFLRGDVTHALLRYCITSPIWFTDGTIDASQAAICIQNEAASLRAADHAAFMFGETQTQIILLHVTSSVSQIIAAPALEPSADLQNWWTTQPGKTMQPFVRECSELLQKEGIASERVRIVVLPSKGKGKVASEILSYCQQQGIGTVVLGHSSPEGSWSFLKSSVTKSILADFKNMAVMVAQ